MRKILSIFLVALLVMAIVPAFFVQKAEAKHTADVFWNDDGNGLLITTKLKALKGSAVNDFVANFSVRNNLTGISTEDDYLAAIRVVLGDDLTLKPLFKFMRGEVYDDTGAPVDNWITDPSEFEGGRARTVTFRAMPEDDPVAPLIAGNTYWFVMYFEAGSGPSTCNYEDAFTVYTEDSGLRVPGGVPGEPVIPETELSGYLDIIIDTELPAITTDPTNGTIVDGIIVPCGQHYFNISVSANDMVPGSTGVIHDTGISWVTIWVDGIVQYNGSASTLPGQTWVLPSANNALWNMPAGTHNMTVTAWDGVGNSNSVFVQFTYAPPPIPTIQVTPTSGTAAPNTWFNSTSGLWLSEQVNYASTHGTKTLGSTTTVEGWNFEEGVAVTINVTAPTYPAMYLTVAKTTTDTNGDGNGTFTATFIFPKAPAGIYVIWVYSTPCNKSATFEVVPEVIYKPDLVVGPAPINVTATGFTAANNTRPSWFFIVPDALQGVNSQINMWWFIDGNGTLQNWLNTYTVGVENVSTTLNWPWMEPGTTTVEIKHIDGDWWNGTGMYWVHKPCFVGGNVITVKETLSLLIDIKADTAYIRTATDTITATLTQLSPVITSINDTVVTLSTTMGTVQATLNQLSPVITSINNNVVTLNTTVGQINTTMATIGPQLATIGPDIATIKTSVGTGLNGTVTSIQGDVATITTDVGNINGQLPTLTNYALIAVIFSVIAAIAAIACAFLVFRKIA